MTPDGSRVPGGEREAWRARDWPPIPLRDLGPAYTAKGGVSVFIMEDATRRDWRSVSAQAAHVLLHAVTGNPTLRIEKDSRGKPFISGQSLHVSISHSGAVFALALGSVDLGIDVEYLRHPARWHAVYDWINRPEDRLANPSADDFLRCWTGKEALVKLLGTGLNQGLDTVSLPHDAAPGATSTYPHALSFKEVTVEGRACWVTHLVPWKEMTVSLAIEKPQFVHTFNIIDYRCYPLLK